MRSTDKASFTINNKNITITKFWFDRMERHSHNPDAFKLSVLNNSIDIEIVYTIICSYHPSISNEIVFLRIIDKNLNDLYVLNIDADTTGQFYKYINSIGFHFSILLDKEFQFYLRKTKIEGIL